MAPWPCRSRTWKSINRTCRVTLFSLVAACVAVSFPAATVQGQKPSASTCPAELELACPIDDEAGHEPCLPEPWTPSYLALDTGLRLPASSPPGSEGRLSKIRARGHWLRSIRGEGSEGIHPASRAWQAYKDQPEPATNRWRLLGPTHFLLGSPPYSTINRMGRVNALAVDPIDSRFLYLGAAAGGLWRSTSSGLGWSLVSEDPRTLAISSIAVNPRDSRHIYLLTGDGNGGIIGLPSRPSLGVLESKDGGETWDFAGRELRDGRLVYGFTLSIDPEDPNILFATFTDGLWKSDDAGQHWRLVKKGSFRDFTFAPGCSRIAYAATTDRVYRSTDGGERWKLVFQAKRRPSFEPELTDRIALAVSHAAPARLNVLVGGATGLVGVYRSDSWGCDFELRSNAPNILGSSPYGADTISIAGYALSFASTPADPDLLFAGSINVWRSEDGGQSWTISSYWNNEEPFPYAHADSHQLLMDDVTKRAPRLYSVNDGGLVVSVDRGRSWLDLSQGLTITQAYRLCNAPNDQQRLIFSAQDNGSNWLLRGAAVPISNSDGTGCAIFPDRDQQGLVSLQNGRILRFDSKAADPVKRLVSVTPPVPGDGSTPDAAFITPFTLDPGNPDTVYACYRDLWRSVDRGQRWRNITGGKLGRKFCVALAVSPVQSRIIHVAKDEGIFTSQDYGETWRRNTPSLPADLTPITDIAASGSDPQRLWITVGGYSPNDKVFESQDSGRTWTNLSRNLPNLPVHTVVHDEETPSALYVGNDIGVYYLGGKEADRQWQAFMQPPLMVLDLAIHYSREGRSSSRIRAATYAQGVWESPLDAP